MSREPIYKIIDGKKICTSCLAEKDISLFIFDKRKSRYTARCAKCTYKFKIAWEKENRKKKGSSCWRTIKRSNARSCAKARGIPFDLTSADFLRYQFNDICFYCEQKIINFTLDRVDNNKGYSVDNCVSCCKRCNTRKGSFTAEELLNLYNKIISFKNNPSLYVDRMQG